MEMVKGGLLEKMTERAKRIERAKKLLEVERALVEAVKPETASDAKLKLGDACAAMVAAYDD